MPASPVTDKLDAFVWTTPVERLSGPAEEWTPLAPEPVLAAPAPAPTLEAAAEIVPPVKTLAPVAVAQPVIFPLPKAPDDPGPEGETELGAGQPEKRRSWSLFR